MMQYCWTKQVCAKPVMTGFGMPVESSASCSLRLPSFFYSMTTEHDEVYHLAMAMKWGAVALENAKTPQERDAAERIITRSQARLSEILGLSP